MKKIIISVTNDVTNDQRVNRVASTLAAHGADVLLVGRMVQGSVYVKSSNFAVHRMHLWFSRGFLFYANYNVSLFFYLLFHKADGLLANDIDTLPANYLVSVLKRIPLVFDSHEYFPEVPEVTHTKWVKRFWLAIEKAIIPRLQYNYTVCRSIANIYSQKYQVPFEVVRNVPFRAYHANIEGALVSFPGKKIVIYQGALNVGRGIETMIESMKYMDDVVLLIAGTGDIEQALIQQVKQEKLEHNVVFLGRIPIDKLATYTKMAHLGFSLEENIGLNYYYALPNKLFDYIQAGVPVLCSDFPEMRAIVTHYDIGTLTLERNPEKLAHLISHLLNDEVQLVAWKTNLEKAAADLCWENEVHILHAVFQKAGLF